MQVDRRPFESVDSLLARFKNEFNRSGLKSEMAKREYFRIDGEKKRAKRKQCLKRLKKRQHWLEKQAQQKDR